MKHLIRAAGLLTAIFIIIFVVPRVMPTPTLLVNYGFQPRQVEANADKWASIPVQYASSATCLDCHNNEYDLWQKGNHKNVSCENCHGPARPHLETRTSPDVDTSRELCGTCHAKLISRPSEFPQVDMNEMGGQASCVSCHNPHEPRAGMPPQVPHSLDNRKQCISCHGPHEPWVTPPPQVPHTMAGRADCLSCHGSKELRGNNIPKIPHSLDGRANCLTCHNSGGIKPFPPDHNGRNSSTCLNCHRSK